MTLTIQRHSKRVLFIPSFKLIQRLLEAKRELKLEALLKKLDGYAAIILDDLGYVQQTREEMEVLFTFLAERYERRSVMIKLSNLVFSKWERIFQDPMTAMAAVDRLVHHSVILEFGGESQRGPKTKRQRNQPADALANCGLHRYPEHWNASLKTTTHSSLPESSKVNATACSQTGCSGLAPAPGAPSLRGLRLPQPRPPGVYEQAFPLFSNNK